MAVNTRIVRLTALSVAVLLQGVAVAQAPPKPSAPIAPKTEQLDPKACAHSDTQSTIGQGNNRGTTGGDIQAEKNGNLSDKLARSDGVICPPSQVDPEIRAPTPPGGAMPVIPPPGSPGGDQSVQPK
jgi:hypothetical protein